MKKTINQRVTIFFTFIFCLLWIVSCAVRPIKNSALPINFLRSKRKIGIIWIVNKENFKPGFYQSGGGLLDKQINNIVQEKLLSRLQRIDLTPTIKEHFLDVFKRAFLFEGQEVEVVNEAYSRKSLRQFKSQSSEKRDFQYDLRPISKSINVDYLLILEVFSYGVTRKYYGFIPMGSPEGFSKIRCVLINGNSNNIMAGYNAKISEHPRGEWDQPPEYPYLIDAMIDAFEKSIDECYFGLFGRSP